MLAVSCLLLSVYSMAKHSSPMCTHLCSFLLCLYCWLNRKMYYIRPAYENMPAASFIAYKIKQLSVFRVAVFDINFGDFNLI